MWNYKDRRELRYKRRHYTCLDVNFEKCLVLKVIKHLRCSHRWHLQFFSYFPAQLSDWNGAFMGLVRNKAVRTVHQAVKRRSKRSRTPRRTWWVIKPSDTCPIKWLPFVSPERNHQSNIIFKNRIVFKAGRSWEMRKHQRKIKKILKYM